MSLGFHALAERHQISTVQALRVRSQRGKSRQSHETPQGLHAVFPPSYQPEDSFKGHFEFGLKYEEFHLEFFARLFAALGPAPIEAWCTAEPYGQYARRTGFLYEWLTGQKLAVPDVSNGAYVDAMPADLYLTRAQPERNRRWRVNDNLPGTRDFCPLVRRTAALQAAQNVNPQAELAQLDAEFGPDLLLRSASWLTFKESQASFTIEHEADKGDRIQRFAHVMAEHCGRIANPLDEPSLRQLQADILGHNALRLGIRRSPVFVGQATLHRNIVHYVAPHFERVPAMLEGLKTFEATTRGLHPVVRAGVLAFGFVYIHPMCDGNGRLHRFLINDTLIRDGAVPGRLILPVSASIINSTRFRADYDHVLEVFSTPLMHRYASAYRFGEQTMAEDGTPVDFLFDAYDDADFAWRYPDLTEHAIYTCKIVDFTIRNQMAEEARTLKRFDTANQRLKDVIEMPNQDAARIIRSIKASGWRVSNKLLKDYPFLTDEHSQARVIEAIQSAFEDRGTTVGSNSGKQDC